MLNYMFNQTDHHRAPFHEMHKVTAFLSYKYFMTLNIFIIEIIKIAAYEVKVFMEIIYRPLSVIQGWINQFAD